MIGTILVGFAEALAAPEVVWSLVDAGHRVVAFTRKGLRCALRASRHVQLLDITPPEVSLDIALSELKEIIVRVQDCDLARPIIVMPLDDVALWLVNQLSMGPTISIAGPIDICADFSFDKSRQIQLATEAGFQTPHTVCLMNMGQASEVEPRFPAILKPMFAVRECEGKLVKMRSWICGTNQEWQAAIKAWGGQEHLLLQPYIRGTGVGLFGLALTSGCTVWSAHERIRMMNPHGSGSSACRSISCDENLKAIGEKLLNMIRWRGIFMIELLRDEQGTYWFIELNGRSWGSMALARRMGFDYPAWAIHMLTDPNWHPLPPDTSTRSVVCRHLGRELIHLAFVARGPRSSALTNWPRLGQTLQSVLSFHKEDTWYNWRRDDWRVFILDVVLLMREQLSKIWR